MACIEHDCPNCDWFGFDNQSIYTCPQCGSDQVSNWYDEADDEHDI